jgi:cyclopropane fatty-acyl-phospholipid synthase-like methyltransferase
MNLQNDRDLYNFDTFQNPIYWKRNGGKPNLKGKVCCDIGSGRGSLAIDMALSGAKKVLGYDISEKKISFAKENLEKNFPQLIEIVEFHCSNFCEIENTENFDVITSKDSFEHIIELENMLKFITIALKKGGILYLGFAPLFYSFYGGHQKSQIIPWLHLLTPKFYMQKHGLNGYSLSYYEELLKNCGLQIQNLKFNQGDKAKFLKIFTKIPLIRELFTHNFYAILRK